MEMAPPKSPSRRRRHLLATGQWFSNSPSDSDWRVMEGAYEIVSELAVGGNIYPSSIEYQAILLSPFFMT